MGSIINQQNSLNIINSISIEVEHCPHCGSLNFYKWGVRSKVQRYKCKECNKTFNVLSKIPLARLRYKEKWDVYAKELISSSSIVRSAKVCDVAVSTSFRWRHRMLKVSKSFKAEKLQGIVEFDEAYFPKSEKGDHNLTRKAHKRGSCELTFEGNSVSTIYQKRWKVEEFYKSLKHNVDLASSPTKTIRTQSNHIFLSILSFFKLECLKMKHNLNHFAMRARLLIKANQMAYQELLILKGE